MEAGALEGGRSLWVEALGLVEEGVLWAPVALLWEAEVGAAAVEVWGDPPVEEEGVVVVAGTNTVQVRPSVQIRFSTCFRSPRSYIFCCHFLLRSQQGVPWS